MAKTKKAAKAVPEILKLTNTLKVENQEYEINAVHSESAVSADRATTAETANVANSVSNALEINASTITGPIKPAPSYDGSTPQTLNYVPSSGGKFTGPILVDNTDMNSIFETNDLSSTEKQLAVLNAGQITNRIAELTGFPLFTWDGSVLECQTMPDGDVVQKVSLVVGTTANFSKLHGNAAEPKAYLYLCTDDKFNIYLKIGANEAIKLAIGAEFLYDKSSNKTLSYEEIIAKFNSINTSSDNLDTRLTAAENNISKNSTAISNNTTAIQNNNKNTIDRIDELNNSIGETLKKLKDGSITVGKAANDSDGNLITTHYYQSTLNTSTPNRIYITTGVNATTLSNTYGTIRNGDIWIKY